MKKKIRIVFPILLGLFLSACGEPATSSASSSRSSAITQKESDDTSEAKKLEFVGVTFSSASFTYDGDPHILPEVSGAPEGTAITYTGRESYTDAGSYTATAKLVKEGYRDTTLSATLTILQATMPSGYTFESKIVTYDGKDHFDDIQLIGVLPEGSNTVVTAKNAQGEVVTSAMEVGTYSYTCVITNKNYQTVTLTAALTIKAQRKDMPVFVSGDGTIYFANGLHNSYLYSLKTSEWDLIDYSTPKEFNKYNSTSAIFISGTTLMNSVKQANAGTTSVLYTDSNIDDFVKYSDNVYYYSSNSLKAAKSGIYKVDATDANNEPVVTKVFEGKSDNLALYNGYLYFTNGNDNNYVYKMNLTSSAISLVLSEKVHEITIDSDRLYCTVNGKLNDYIGYLDLSSSQTEATKLTNAAGEFLTVKNGYLYYHYTDLFSVVDSSLKGVWRIRTSGGTPEQLLANDGVNGFDVESSSSLVYIDSSDLHLYRYSISSKTKIDLLKGFVAPEVTPLNMGGRTISYGTKTYYLNMYAGKTLYVYDESLKRSSQLTTNKVEDFYLYDDILYFNEVTRFTNNDLYAVNVVTGGEAEKINSNDVRNLVSDGTYLYATHYNWAGLAGGLSRMKLDGGDYLKFSEVNGADDLTVKDGKLYYTNNGNIESIALKDITATSAELEGTNLSDKIKNVKQFIFDGNDIFYIYNGIIDNSVRRTDFTSLGEGTKLASSKTNPSEILLNGNYVYYYSFAVSAASSAGFYRVSKTATKDGTQELILGYDSQYYASSLSISAAGYLYFLNYIPKLTLGDAHFYQLNLAIKSVIKIN